jgi:hypothetical protein
MAAANIPVQKCMVIWRLQEPDLWTWHVVKSQPTYYHKLHHTVFAESNADHPHLVQQMIGWF